VLQDCVRAISEKDVEQDVVVVVRTLDGALVSSTKVTST